MKIIKFLLIISLLFFAIAISHVITKAYYIDKVNNWKIETEKANTKTIKVESDKLYWKNKCDSLEQSLVASFEDTNYQEPPKTDNDIEPYYDYIDFVPDYLPDLSDILNDIDREVSIKYLYRDGINGYNVDFAISYIYKDEAFRIVPFNLSKTQTKNYKFCAGLYYHAQSFGIKMDYDIWRFRFGGDIGFMKDMTPDAGISVGWKF